MDKRMEYGIAGATPYQTTLAVIKKAAGEPRRLPTNVGTLSTV